jgi:hypothetical protein
VMFCGFEDTAKSPRYRPPSFRKVPINAFVEATCTRKDEVELVLLASTRSCLSPEEYSAV